MIDAEASFWHRVTELPVLLSLLTFLTLVATWMRTSMVERRNRRWAAKDLKEAEKLKKEERDRIAREQRELTRVTHAKIDANTAISRAAFREANTVNQKIKRLGDALVVGQIEQTEVLKEAQADEEEAKG